MISEKKYLALVSIMRSSADIHKGVLPWAQRGTAVDATLRSMDGHELAIIGTTQFGNYWAITSQGVLAVSHYEATSGSLASQRRVGG